MRLRGYQIAALEASKAAFLEGIRRQLIALPTGCGKTVVFASVPKFHKIDKRVFVLVHREELADQAAEKLKLWNPDMSVGVEMAARRASAGDQLIVASVPTLAASISRETERIKRFDPTEVGAVITDECHHSTAPSYMNVYRYFGLEQPDNNTLFLGVTATPNRGDGVALATVYDRIVYQYTIQDGIGQGYLADMRGMKIKTRVNLDRVHTLGGDFVQNELASAVNNPQRNGEIVKAWIENAYPRQTVAFCADIQHAQDLAAAFQKNGVPAQAIWGDDAERADKLAKHKLGELKVLTNCNILTEGYDDWQIGCIIMARPTKSQLLFTQMAGRGTRIQPGIDNLIDAAKEGIKIEKPDCLLMDVVDATSRHSLVTLASLFGMNGEMDLKGKSAFKALQRIQQLERDRPEIDLSNIIDVDKLDDVQVEFVSLFQAKVPEIVAEHSELRWRQNMDGTLSLSLPGGERVWIRQDLLGKYNVGGTVSQKAFYESGYDNFADAVRMAELQISKEGQAFINMLRREWKTGDAPVTPPQLNLIRKLLKRRPELAEVERRVAANDLTKQQASVLIDNIIHQKTRV